MADSTEPYGGSTGRSDAALVSRCWHVDLRDDASAYLRDHRVQGVVILPGSVYLEMAVQVAATGGQQPVVLDAVSLERFLVLPDDRPLRIEALVRAAPDRSMDLEIVSTRHPAGAAAGGRTTHARIRVRWQPHRTLSLRLGDNRPEDVLARCPVEIRGAELYVDLEKHGNQYGPAFQGVDRLWLGSGEAIGAVRLPARLEPQLQSRPWHPVILDAATQVLAAAAPRPGHSVVLVGYDEVRSYGPLGIQGWAHARLVPDPGGSTDDSIGNVRVLDAAGRTAVELVGVRFRYLPSVVQSPSSTTRPTATLAIAGSFTVEPVEHAIRFWTRSLDLAARAVFAPYRQVLQSLLDRTSVLSQNRDGLNVVLVRLEDLAPGHRAAGARGPTAVSSPTDGLDRYALPNGQTIAHLNPYETDFLYQEIYADRVYFQHGIELPLSACVVDVGANIGLFSRFVLETQPAATVYAFEPAPAAFAALARNVAAYGPRVTVVRRGLSNAAGSASLTVYPKSSAFSTLHPDRDEEHASVRAVASNTLRRHGLADGEVLNDLVDRLIADRLDSETVTCELTTLSDVIREHALTRIDLLKIDAEKSELEILAGIEAEHWPTIGQVVLEVHDRSGTRLGRVRSLLAEQGFDVVVDQAALLAGTGFSTVYARRLVRPETKALPVHPAAPSTLDRAVDDLIRAVQVAATSSGVPILVCVCPPSPAALVDASLATSLRLAETRLTSALEDLSLVHVVGSEMLLRTYPVPRYDDPIRDRLGHIPYTAELFAALGTTIVRTYAAIQRDPYKVIVLDCDETLWKGACGEDGPFGIEIDAPRRVLQEEMIRQREAGMLLAICSKNNPGDVERVFDTRRDMPLQRRHVSAWRVNWRPKSENLGSLADELGLGLDSVIVVDDSPIECAEIRARCPEVLTLQLPADPSDIPAFLQHVWAFDHLEVTEADRERAGRYQQQQQRDRLRHASMTLADFLAGLDLQVRIAEADESSLARVAQLFQRVNQFATSPVRCSEAELRALIDVGGVSCLVVDVSDRFGQYGQVGAMLVRPDGRALVVDALLLSCRALGRGVEHLMLARLGEITGERGLERVDVRFTPTGRNQPAFDFLESIGRDFRVPTDDATAPLPRAGAAGQAPGMSTTEELRYALPAAIAAAVRLDPDLADAAPTDAGGMQMPQASPSRSSSRGAQGSRREWIPMELRDVGAILRAIDGGRRRSIARPADTIATTPANERERAVAAIWQRVLGVDEVSVDDNFFEIGGTSILAVEVMAELDRSFHVELSTLNLFEVPTIRALAQLLAPGAGAREAEAQRLDRRARGEARRARHRSRPRSPRPDEASPSDSDLSTEGRPYERP